MSDFNERVIEQFRANEGRVGPPFEGMPMLLLHTRGAKSGEPRINPLATFEEPESWLIVASAGGSPRHPAWYHNLRAHPETTIEVGTETVPVRATVIGPEERPGLWQHIVSRAPAFASYESRTGGREIPIVRLSRR